MVYNNVYNVEFVFAENDDLIIPNKLEEFELIAVSVEDALRELDIYLYSKGLTNSRNDYEGYYNHDDTECEVSFADSEKGLQLRYSIKES